MVEITGVTISDTILVALVSGLIGFVPTFFGAYYKFRRDLQASYDKDLRSRRIEVYLNLWKLLEPLAKYAPPQETVTRETFQELMINLRSWYFGVGGLFLSDDTRDYYFALMDELEKTVKIPSGKYDELEQAYKSVKQKGSNLRQSLSRDVGTRKKPVL